MRQLKRQRRLTPPESLSFPCQGGLYTDVPPSGLPPGVIIASEQYECVSEGGYHRIDGFERFDGRTLPSDATYYLLYYDSGEEAIAVDQEITDGGAKVAEVIVAGVVSTGSYAGGDAAGYLIVTNVTGTWAEDDEIQVGGVNKADVASGGFVERGASTDALDATYIQAAIEWYRDQITEVDDAARQIRGVWALNGTVYAFQDNAGGTACGMFKSSSSGWTACELGETLDFDTGSTEYSDGDSITQGAVSATVRNVVVQSGTWGGNNAAGFFVITGRTGGNFAAGATGGDGVANATGAQTATTLTNGGTYRFCNHNFGGSADTLKMFGVNGVDKGFQWDGTYFTPLDTGMDTDTPTRVTAHKNQLFLMFDSEAQHSSIGDPELYTLLTGSDIIALGDTCTDLIVTPGETLALLTRNSRSILYGSSSADWNLKDHSPTAGAIAHTVQEIAGSIIYYDDRGIQTLRTAEAYGDFKAATISKHIQTIIDDKKDNITCSVHVRSKDQYRVFFDDNTALYYTFGPKGGFALVDLGMVVRCACSVEDSSGNEEIYFGSDDGYVYKMDSGTSLDGSEVQGDLRLAFYHYGSPRQNKDFLSAIIELSSINASTTLSVTPDFSYSDPDLPAANAVDAENVVITGGGDYYNVGTWNDFYWSQPVVGTGELYINGFGINLGFLIQHDSTYDYPHTIHSVQVFYNMEDARHPALA